MEADSPKATALGFETTWIISGEGNGNPLQYFCLENPMDSQDILSEPLLQSEQPPTANHKPTVSEAAEARPSPWVIRGTSLCLKGLLALSFTPEAYLAESGSCAELRTGMRPDFLQEQSLPTHLTGGSCLLL